MWPMPARGPMRRQEPAKPCKEVERHVRTPVARIPGRRRARSAACSRTCRTADRGASRPSLVRSERCAGIAASRGHDVRSRRLRRRRRFPHAGIDRDGRRVLCGERRGRDSCDRRRGCHRYGERCQTDRRMSALVRRRCATYARRVYPTASCLHRGANHGRDGKRSHAIRDVLCRRHQAFGRPSGRHAGPRRGRCAIDGKPRRTPDGLLRCRRNLPRHRVDVVERGDGGKHHVCERCADALWQASRRRDSQGRRQRTCRRHVRCASVRPRDRDHPHNRGTCVVVRSDGAVRYPPRSCEPRHMRCRTL